MSRSGYVDDGDPGEFNLWRGSVQRALYGRRGQSFLREMAGALDAMPVKELIAGDLVTDSGCVCALGSVAVARGLDVSSVDESDPEEVADAFGLARAMVREIAYENDEGAYEIETPAERWTRMRGWVEANLKRQKAP